LDHGDHAFKKLMEKQAQVGPMPPHTHFTFDFIAPRKHLASKGLY
jgi:hypothetical protein